MEENFPHPPKGVNTPVTVVRRLEVDNCKHTLRSEINISVYTSRVVRVVGWIKRIHMRLNFIKILMCSISEREIGWKFSDLSQ